MAFDDDIDEGIGALAALCDHFCCTPIYNFFYKCFTGFEPLANNNQLN